MNRIFIVMVCLFCSKLYAENLSGQARIDFVAIGKPSMLKIKGTSEGAVSQFKLSANKLSGEIKLNRDLLKTGIELRDQHMKKKYLQIQNFPEATLKFKDFVMPNKWSVLSPTVTENNFKAILKLHGVEKEIDGMEALLPPMKSFVLPGGHQSVSFCHVARTVCRRAERLVIALDAQEKVDHLIIQYLNRLSDYLFMLSRKMTQELGVEETPWKPRM